MEGDVGRRRDLRHQGSEEGLSPQLVKDAAPSQLIPDGDKVHGPAGVEHLPHHLVGGSVVEVVKILRPQGLQGDPQGLVLEKARAQNGPLRVQVLGRDPVVKLHSVQSFWAVTDSVMSAWTPACNFSAKGKLPGCLMTSSILMSRLSTVRPYCRLRASAT